MSKSGAKSFWKIGEGIAHSSDVNCLSLSPSNGRMLVTGGDDRKINLWVIGKPNAIMSISGITSPVQSVTFNNSENWIGGGSKSGVIKVFDLDENRVVRSISGHKAAICSLDFHRYGDILASGSMDTNLKLWDVRRKGCIFTYKGHSESINSVQFSPDGRWIVSASSDSTVKLWDLSAGRLLADFKEHRGPVTSVKFHPKDYLLATGSSDKTAKVWDLESFSLVSETSPESNAIRCILFHPDGAALFTGSQDAMKVHGWEPTVLHDHLSLRWGKVADIAVYEDQLIGASFAQTNVSTWCVNIKNLRPFSGESGSPQPSSTVAPLSSSGRRHFEYEKREVASHPSSNLHKTNSSNQEKGAEGGVCSPSSTSNEDNSSNSGVGDSPPTELKDEERREIFATRQRLMRTPPKFHNDPFLPPPGDDPTLQQPPHQDTPTPHPPKPSELNRVQVLQVHSSDDRVLAAKKDVHQPPLNDRKVIDVAGGVPPQPSGQVVRQSQDNHGRQEQGRGVRLSQQKPKKAPRRGLIDDFMPPAQVNESKKVVGGGLHAENQAAFRVIGKDHSDVCSIFKSRLGVLKEARSVWSVSEPKLALEVAINSGDPSALVDLLNVLHLKRTLWTLEMSLLVLPELHSLISSKHSSHVKCGCKMVKLILKSFGPLIKTNLTTPPSHGGIDITREERYERCLTCHSHLTSLRNEALRLVRDTPTSPAGKVVREQNLLNTFAILD